MVTKQMSVSPSPERIVVEMKKFNSEMLFVDYFDEWIELYKKGAIRDITLKKYYSAAKRLREIAPDLTIADLDRRSYQMILNEYALTHEKQTCTDFHHQIKSCILDMFHDRLIDRDPTFHATIKGKIAGKKKRKFLNEAELVLLIKALDLQFDISWDWLILLLAKTGLRFSEALAITPADFDFKKKILIINKTWNYKGSGGFLPTKNQSSARTVSLDASTNDSFRFLVKGMPASDPIFIKKHKDGSYKRVFNASINKRLSTLCKKVEINEITIHGLRHTHASILLAAGVSIQSIANRLGHSSVTTTQEIYAHVIDELARKDDELVAETLGRIA